MPRLSVIVPVYNTERLLSRCIDSILSQSFQDLELILIDDGSSDRSGEICDLYAIRDFRVKVFHTENAGVSAARNRGLDEAEGEYCTFVDSDDFIEADMYESMLKTADQYSCDMVMCDCVKEYENYQEPYTHDIRPGYYSREQLEKEYFPHLLIMPNVEYPPTISNWLCLYRQSQRQKTDCITDAGETKPTESNIISPLRYVKGIRFSEDLLFGAQMISRSNSFYYMKGCNFYHYDCTNLRSATHKFVPDKWNDFKKLYKCIREEFGSCGKYDFGEQIDKTLLFFVLNTVGEIMATETLDRMQKLRRIDSILSDQDVQGMFQRLQIIRLPVSRKLKIWILCYKYRIFLGLLCRYSERKRPA